MSRPSPSPKSRDQMPSPNPHSQFTILSFTYVIFISDIFICSEQIIFVDLSPWLLVASQAGVRGSSLTQSVFPHQRNSNKTPLSKLWGKQMCGYMKVLRNTDRAEISIIYLYISGLCNVHILNVLFRVIYRCTGTVASS